jgi:hypothetical protein
VSSTSGQVLVAQWITRQPSIAKKAEDCGFDPHLGYWFVRTATGLAQLVEHEAFRQTFMFAGGKRTFHVRLPNLRAAGSSPAFGIFYFLSFITRFGFTATGAGVATATAIVSGAPIILSCIISGFFTLFAALLAAFRAFAATTSSAVISL